jgi:hypothetical protein
MRVEYERQQYGERGPYLVWGFRPKTAQAFRHHATEAFWALKELEHLENKSMWQAVETLRSEGLITTVPHLVENARPDCELLHGFGWAGAGEAIEQQLGSAADAAGRFILQEQRLYTAEKLDGFHIFAPVYGTQTNVQMVGIFRLTYRPKTRLTEEWWGATNERAQDWMQFYAQIHPLQRVVAQVV